MGKKLNLDVMSVDEMWHLYEQIVQVLSVKLMSEKRELERRLARLRREKEKLDNRSRQTLSSRRMSLG